MEPLPDNRMNLRVGIFSLKFSPGHLAHVLALRSLLKELSIDVDIFLDTKYADYDRQMLNDIAYSGPLEAGARIDVAIFQNPSTKNSAVAGRLKSQFGTKVIYHYHEPYHSLRAYAHEGLVQAAKILAAHYYSKGMLKISDVIIVHSRFAQENYMRRDIRFNLNNIYIPLMLDDESCPPPEPSHPAYFTFIGHAVPGHRFDLFLELIESGLLDETGTKYRIVTRSDISWVLRRRGVRSLLGNGRLNILQGHPIATPVLNAALRSSLGIWSLYSRCSQSGVIPKAFMYGVPVLSSQVGSLAEFVKDGYNGVVCSSLSVADIAVAVERMLATRATLSEGARRTFMDTFHYRNYLDQYRGVLGLP